MIGIRQPHPGIYYATEGAIIWIWLEQRCWLGSSVSILRLTTLGSGTIFSPRRFRRGTKEENADRFAAYRASPMLIGTTEHRTVSVWGKLQTVTLNRSSKSIWIAVGDYRGETIETKASSELSALSGWQRSARERHNS